MISSKTVKLSLLFFIIVAVVVAIAVILNDYGKIEVENAEQQETFVDTVGLLENDVVRHYSTAELEQAASYLDKDSGAPLPGGNTEASVVYNSILICEGTVVDVLTELHSSEGGNSLWFTRSKVSIKKVQTVTSPEAESISIKSRNDDMIIDIVQTGAILEDGSMVNDITDAPLLENGRTYVLFLAAYDNWSYVPVGGRLGVADNGG